MSTLPRLTGAKNSGSTLASLSASYQTPAYAATIALLIPYQSAKTIVQPAVLTGAVTFTVALPTALADDNAPFVGDIIEFQLTADSTARIVTFGSGFTSTGTLTVAASASATISFKFNGTTYLQTAVGNPRDVVNIQTPAYAASIAITTTKKTTEVIPAQLTGALTVTAVVTGALIGDILIFVFSADGTNRVVTFSTNINSAGTLTVVASKFGSASFCYNGTAWIETARALTA